MYFRAAILVDNANLVLHRFTENACQDEFRQIICTLNKQIQYKQHFGKISKHRGFEVDINNNGISCNYYVTINGRKGG